MRKLFFIVFTFFLVISGNKVSANNKFIENNVVTIYTPAGIGSGSIVGKNKNIYYVLTAKHVIDGFKKNEVLEIKTGDGEFWEAAVHKFYTKNSGSWLDLALIQFKTKRCYPLANIGIESYFASAAFEPGMPFDLTVAGYAAVDKSISKSPLLRVSKGKVASKINTVTAVGQKELRESEGYQYGYTAPTARGMSGGPVYIKADGILKTFVNAYNPPLGLQIMVHGRGEADNLRGNNKTGFNFAIPLWLFAEGLNEYNPELLKELNTEIYYINEIKDPDQWGETSDDDLAKHGAYDKNRTYPDGFEVAEGVCKPDGLIPIKPKNAMNNNHIPGIKSVYERIFKK